MVFFPFNFFHWAVSIQVNQSVKICPQSFSFSFSTSNEEKHIFFVYFCHYIFLFKIYPSNQSVNPSNRGEKLPILKFRANWKNGRNRESTVRRKPQAKTHDNPKGGFQFSNLTQISRKPAKSEPSSVTARFFYKAPKLN